MARQARSFDEWMERVDAMCWKLAGRSAYDLPDYGYRDAYDDEASPGCAARRAMRYAMEG